MKDYHNVTVEYSRELDGRQLRHLPYRIPGEGMISCIGARISAIKGSRVESSHTMRIRTESPAESTEPILSGHGAEQRSMERNYHLLASGTPLRSSSRRLSISPDPPDYFLNISAVFVSVSLPPPLRFLSLCLTPVCSSSRPRADTPLIVRSHAFVRIYMHDTGHIPKSPARLQ